MSSRGPRDTSSRNCPGFGDQLNGRTHGNVPSAMCHDLDDLHDLNVLHDLNDLNDFHDLHKWTLTNENSPFYHVKKVHIKNCM